MTILATNPIATLNDRFRQTFTGGRVMMTQGVQALGPTTIEEILVLVREFDRFDEANDPHGEHDFGAIEHQGEKLFWKIDYYDPTFGFGSEDPADPIRTRRVLTVMLAEEY